MTDLTHLLQTLDERVAFAIRALSLFHFVMPLVAGDAVRRLGYDRRALPLQIATAAIVLPLTVAIAPQILAFGGVFDLEARSSSALGASLFLVLVTCCYLPAHAVLSRWRLAGIGLPGSNGGAAREMLEPDWRNTNAWNHD